MSTMITPPALQGWHHGETAIHAALGYTPFVTNAFEWVSNSLNDQHRTFHTTRLPFVALTTLDEEGRPWSSLVSSADGELGFIHSRTPRELTVNATLWDGDPALSNLNTARERNRGLIAGLGIELSTRRRNKFAGTIDKVEGEGKNLVFTLGVNQALGNCPKYITIRSVVPHPNTSPKVVYHNLHLAESDRLPEEVISFIHAADAVYLGTTYVAPEEDAKRFPSHLGMNHRGGRPGFVRVRPSDGRTLVLPDYSGNRFMSSLGNIVATPLASLAVPAFDTGDILYLTGEARMLIGAEALALMPRSKVVTTIRVTGFSFVKDALPVRMLPGTPIEPSPYSPPIHLLAEESASTVSYDDASILLKRIELHPRIPTAELATFTFTAPEGIDVQPGQAAIIDLSDFSGKRGYQHMARTGDESSLNDDCIRTWTVSDFRRASEPGSSGSFSITVREKKDGVITPKLLSIARKLLAARPDLLADTTQLDLRLKLVGISGDFVLPPPKPQQKLLWLAGGVGITPYLSMMRAIVDRIEREDISWNIVLMVSTKEPEVMLQLISDALNASSPPLSSSKDLLHIQLHIFSSSPLTICPALSPFIDLETHTGRIAAGGFTAPSDLGEREVYVCGPPGFESSAMELLKVAGFDTSQVHREGFSY